MNPWKAARIERIRAEVNRRACEAAVAEAKRIRAQLEATARLLAGAEEVIRELQDRRRLADPAEMRRLRTALAIKDDVIRALEDRLEAARDEIAAWERDYGPVARARAIQERDSA